MSLIIFPQYTNPAGTLVPGSGNSVLFNGVTDYVEFPYRSAYDFGAADWTVECFVKFPEVPTANQSLFSFSSFTGGNQSPYLWFVYDGTYLSLQEATSTAGTAASTYAPWTATKDTWYHVAFVRYNNVISIYVDGLLIGSKAFSGSQLGGMNAVVGAIHYGFQGYPYKFNGLISNLRVTKSAVYAAQFVRLTAALVALPNTVLLTCMGDIIIDKSVQAAPATFGGNPAVDVSSPFDPYYSKLSLLMHMNGANGSTNFVDVLGHSAVSIYGAPTLSTAQSKFGGSSLSLNGSSGIIYSNGGSADFSLGTADFTQEAWVYPTARSTVSVVIGNVSGPGNGGISLYVNGLGGITSSTFSTSLISSANNLVPLNTWTHIAATRSGTVLTIWINGVNVGSINNLTSAWNFTDGACTIGCGLSAAGFTGYIDDVRITKGVARYKANFIPSANAFPGDTYTGNGDPFYSNVSLLMHFEEANGSTTFTDEKGSVYTPTIATISTAQKKFGSSAFYGPSTATSKLLSANSGALAFGTGDFTVEFWVYFSDPAQGYHQWLVSSTGGASSFTISRFYTNGALVYGNQGGGTNKASAKAIPLSTWAHVAVCRVAGTTRLFINGVLDSSFADTNSYTDTRVEIGGISTATGRELSGYMDELRVTKGVGRYITGAPLQTAPFPNN